MPPKENFSGISEIDSALKEFELKSAENEKYKAIKFFDQTDTPKVVKLVMKYSGGAIKEQKTAEYILFALVIIAVSISIFIFITGGNSGHKSSQEEFQAMQKFMSTN